MKFFSGFVKSSAVIAFSVGTMYFEQRKTHYKNLQKSLGIDAPISLKSVQKIPAKDKDWIIIGRQSPRCVRDSVKNPKESKQSGINASDLYLKTLGTAIDNEKHYSIAQNATFEVQLFCDDPFAPHILVSVENMLSIEINDIPDDELFAIGFAKIQGFLELQQAIRKNPSINLIHSSIALQRINNQKIPPDICVLSGKEIKQILSNTEKNICGKQHYSLYNSNCYSVTVYAMTQMIAIFHERFEADDSNTKNIARILLMLKQAIQDNLSLGVANNPIVRRQIMNDTHNILLERGLLPSEKTTFYMK